MRVLLDACVLYPTVSREILFGLAATGWMELAWSARILEEWRRAVIRNLPEQAEQVAMEIATAQARFPDAGVTPDAGAADMLRLPDPDDTHVLAAALAARADAIVTFNLRDFPGRSLAQHGMMVRHPDAVLLEAFHADPALMRDIVTRVLAPLTPTPDTDMRRLLKKARLPRLGKALTS